MGYLTDEEYERIRQSSRQRILAVPDALKVIDYPPSPANRYQPVSFTELPNGDKVTTYGPQSREKLLTLIHFLINKHQECQIVDKASKQPLSEMRYGAPVFREAAANYLCLDDNLDREAVLRATNGKITYKKTRKCQGCGKSTHKAPQAQWCATCKPKQRALHTRKWRANRRKYS